MTKNEFNEQAARLAKLCPRAFTDEHFAILSTEIQVLDVEDFKDGIKTMLCSSAHVNLADLIAATKMAAEGRKRKTNPESPTFGDCAFCRGSGWVNAKDPQKYLFAFRCSCPASRGLSSTIPTWDANFAAQYTRC